LGNEIRRWLSRSESLSALTGVDDDQINVLSERPACDEQTNNPCTIFNRILRDMWSVPSATRIKYESDSRGMTKFEQWH